MIQTGNILQGRDGRTYQLGNKLAEGGEGIVYSLDGGQQVAKIYRAAPTNTMQRKLLGMLKYQVDLRQQGTNIPLITWPQDLLFKDGNFAGYVMPLVSGGFPIWQVVREDTRNKVFNGQYDWTLSLATAANLSSLVAHLHQMNITIGDMNSNNILVHPNGCITIIDVDSFDIRDRDTGEHFKCTVGRPEFLPPELQGRNLSSENALFTEETDNYALAIHIFQLLFCAHPFNQVTMLDHDEGSLVENPQEQAIVNGECPFVHPELADRIPPGVPHLDRLLPDYLQRDFQNTFSYTAFNSMQKREQRTKAETWKQDLVTFYGEKGINLIQCSQNNAHYYYDFHNGQGCELCRVAQATTWSLTQGAFNNSDTDNQTDLPSLSSSDTWRIHFSVINSPYSMEQPLCARYVYPDGNVSDVQQLQSYKTGDEICVSGCLQDLGQSQTGFYRLELLDYMSKTIATKQFQIAFDVEGLQKQLSEYQWQLSQANTKIGEMDSAANQLKKQKKFFSWGLSIALMAVVVLLAVLWNQYDQKNQIDMEWNSRYASLESENRSLASEKESLASEKEALASKNESLASEKESLASQNKSLASEKEALASENKSMGKCLGEVGISISDIYNGNNSTGRIGDGSLVASKMRYLCFEYSVFFFKGKMGTATIYVDIYNPDGTLRQGQSSPAGHSLSLDNVSSGKTGNWGFGNSDVSVYSAGTYRLDFVFKDTIICSKKVVIK